ncbi:hypothetical protein Hanom_Chr10g00956791 [Helianthus anomalus]
MIITRNRIFLSNRKTSNPSVNPIPLSNNLHVSECVAYVYFYIVFLFNTSKLQVLSFIFVSNFRRCPLPLKLMSFVLNVFKCYTVCSLALTQLDFSVKSGHMSCTSGQISQFP